MQRNEAAVRQVLRAEAEAHARTLPPGAGARGMLAGLAIGGFVPFAIGLALMLAKWPHLETFGPGELVAVGSPTAAGWGAALVGLGALPLVVALVGFGVRLGIHAAKDQ